MKPMLVKTIGAALLAAALQAALAEPAAGPHGALYMYQGADRDQRVLAGAKKEGRVVVYTSLNTKDSVPIVEVFGKKYGVKGDLWRPSGGKGLQRAGAQGAA